MKTTVSCVELAEGEPQLTMTSISSLNDLAPFFAGICRNVTRQQTKNQGRGRVLPSPLPGHGHQQPGHSRMSHKKAAEKINAIIERDFLEATASQQ